MFQLMGEATAAAEYSGRVVKSANDVLAKINKLEKELQKKEVQYRANSTQLDSVQRQLTAKTRQNNVLRREVSDLKAKQEITLSSDEDFNKSLAAFDALKSPKKESEEAGGPSDAQTSSQEDP